MPKGETSDVVAHLKGIEEFDSVYISSLADVTYSTITKHVAWDHEHFRHALPEVH